MSKQVLRALQALAFVSNVFATSNEVTIVKTDACTDDSCGGEIFFTACEDYSLDYLVSAEVELKIGGDLELMKEYVYINGAVQGKCNGTYWDCQPLADCFENAIDVTPEASTGIIEISYDASHHVNDNLQGCDYFGLSGVAAAVEATLILTYSQSPPSPPGGHLQAKTKTSYCQSNGCSNTITFNDYDYYSGPSTEVTAQVILSLGGDLNDNNEYVEISGDGIQASVQCDGSYEVCKESLAPCLSTPIDVSSEVSDNEVSITYDSSHQVSAICNCYFNKRNVAVFMRATLFVCTWCKDTFIQTGKDCSCPSGYSPNAASDECVIDCPGAFEQANQAGDGCECVPGFVFDDTNTCVPDCPQPLTQVNTDGTSCECVFDPTGSVTLNEGSGVWENDCDGPDTGNDQCPDNPNCQLCECPRRGRRHRRRSLKYGAIIATPECNGDLSCCCA